MASNQQLTTAGNNRLAPFRDALAKAQQGLAQALPATVRKYLTPDRLAKITLGAISRSPQLLQCTPQSVLLSVMQSASLGLEPSGPLGHAYLVPYKNDGQYEAQLIVGYRGYIALARRSGEIESVAAHAVYSRDKLTVNLSQGEISHAPFMPELPPEEKFFAMTAEEVDELTSRGRLIAVYCVAKFVGGGQHVDFMTVGDVEKIRQRSRARDNGPWRTDYDEMAKKTVVRRAAKYWPLSTELSSALDAESKAEAGELSQARAEVAFQVFDGEAPAEGVTMKVTEKVAKKLAAKLEQEAATPAHDESTGEVAHVEAPADHDYGPPPMTDDEIAASEPAPTREERERSFKAKHKRAE